MAMTNNLKKQLDLPLWEWLKESPAGSNTPGTCTSTAQDGKNRFIYYQYPGLFYRYDTWADSWIALIPPTYYATSGATAMRLSTSQGNRGRILESLSSTQFRIPYLAGGTGLIDTELRVTAGPGTNQVRKITNVSDAVTHDGGYATSASGGAITDTTKKWKVNQWIGYTCRAITGVNQAEQRTIIGNTENILYFTDVNVQQYEPWDNQGFRNTVTTTYEIASQIITVDSAFTVTPNNYSRFLVKTGVIWLVSNNSSAPFFTFQMYDILTNTWYQKTMNNQLLPSGLATDVSIECFDETIGAVVSGTATAGTIRTLTDSALTMSVDRYRNYELRIVEGTGAGQTKRIVGNRTSSFEVDSKWTIAPDATSKYQVYPDTKLVYFVGNGQCGTFAYHIEADMWITGPYFDYGVLGNTTVKRDGDVAYGIASGVRATTGVTSIAVSVAGSNYIVGDVLTISTGSATAQCYVTATDALGGVTAVELRRCGSGYTVGVKATTGGTGTACTINVLTIGTIGTIVTTLTNAFKTGDTVTVAGGSEAAWNTTYTIKGVYGLTTFDVEITATANLAATSATTTSLLVDANEAWDVNEHTGKFVLVVQGGSITPATQIRRITSNTANTLTVPAVGAFTPTTGTTRYIILDPASYGRDTKFYPKDQYAFGYATSGSTTTLIDTSKNWIRGNWVGHVVRIVAGTGLGNELTITANNNNTLVFAATTFTPDATTRYEIMDTYGTATSGSTTTIVDTTKNWITNQWVGKRARVIGGSGQTIEVAITANTNNTLTFAATTAMDSTSNYVIYGIPARSAGIFAKWTFGNGNDNYLWCNTGGGTALFQRLNLNNQTYDYGLMVTGTLGEGFTTGSSFVYDTKDTILMQQNSVGRIFALDVKKREFNAGGTIPYTMSTAFIGNRMDLIQTEDGLLYMYLMRNNGTNYWRVLVFWT
jgi:hypothetical protein